jgi:hypothetical protein
MKVAELDHYKGSLSSAYTLRAPLLVSSSAAVAEPTAASVATADRERAALRGRQD